MGKKVIYRRRLVVGFFYLHGDRNGGHPVLLYKKIDHKNIYYVVQFTSKPGHNRILLKHNIDERKSGPSYVRLIPIVCKRNTLGPKILTNLKLNKEDKDLIRFIKNKK